MSEPRLLSRIPGLLLTPLVVGALVLPLPAPAAAQLGGIQFATPGFQINWAREDYPVQQGQAARSWTWGPTSNAITNEPYAEAPGGQRQVQYFDKARMELTNPADPVVTNGLLVRELVGGFVATGDAATQPSSPAQVPVAGDPAAGNPAGPTYASFRGVASINGGNRAPNRVGESVNQAIDKAGVVSPILGNPNRLAYYDETLGHNVPQVFWDFLNQSGTIYFTADGQFGQQAVYSPWQTVMGLPISEPYLMQTNVGGAPTSVLVQLFERRVLTFTPSNPQASQVEMGNVGQHYYAWRYQSQPTPPPPPAVTPAFTSGPRHATITNVTAELIWQTNTPATSRVDWGTDPNRLGGRAGSADNYVDNHRVTLEGLTPGTVYYWRVDSQVQAGGTLRSNLFSFRTTTPALPPTPVPGRAPAIIVAPTVHELTATSATIVWTTDLPTSTALAYGTSAANLDLSASLLGTTPNHIIAISQLSPNTTYYYRPEGRTAEGQSLPAEVLSFRTPAR